MEKKKLDWIISIIKENMVANAAGSSGGFSSSGDQTKAGFDTVMTQNPIRRNKPQIFAKGGPGSRKKWLDYLNNK